MKENMPSFFLQAYEISSKFYEKDIEEKNLKTLFDDFYGDKEDELSKSFDE